MLQELLISSAGVQLEMRDGRWKRAVLVTSCHTVQIQWNEHALQQHCQASGAKLYQFAAEDTIRGRPLTTKEKWELVKYMMKDKGYSARMKQ